MDEPLLHYFLLHLDRFDQPKQHLSISGVTYTGEELADLIFDACYPAEAVYLIN